MEASFLPRETTAFADVIRHICAMFGIQEEALFRSVSAVKAVEARRLAMALCVRYCGASVHEVSVHFGVIEMAVTLSAQKLDALCAEFTLSRRSSVPELLDFLYGQWLECASPHRSYHAVDEIQREVARVFQISREDMLSMRRTGRLITPRHLAIALAKHLTRRSLPEIGRRFGGRDHTTVLHAVRKMQPVMDALIRDVKPDAPLAEWVAIAKRLVDDGALMQGHPPARTSG